MQGGPVAASSVWSIHWPGFSDGWQAAGRALRWFSFEYWQAAGSALRWFSFEYWQAAGSAVRWFSFEYWQAADNAEIWFCFYIGRHQTVSLASYSPWTCRQAPMGHEMVFFEYWRQQACNPLLPISSMREFQLIIFISTLQTAGSPLILFSPGNALRVIN